MVVLRIRCNAIKLSFCILAIISLLLGNILSGKSYYPPRIAFVEGKASYEPAGEVEWSEVTINLPLLSGDRIVSLPKSRVEIELGEGNFLRMGEDTDIIFGNIMGVYGDVDLKIGEIVLRVTDTSKLYVHLPLSTVKIKKRGYYHFFVDNKGVSQIVVWKGKIQVENSSEKKDAQTGDYLLINHSDKISMDTTAAIQKNELDLWSDRRDARFAVSDSVSKLGASYAGVYDLDHHGLWEHLSNYGDVWFPSVTVGWAPYRLGRWGHYSNWGWTWISNEPWGWLPYHYGQWHYYEPYQRWCWAPGNFSYWSPARVNFYWGSGYVGWSPLGYSFGFGSRPGRYHGNIDNSVTIINNYNTRGGPLTVVTEENFRRSKVGLNRVRTLSKTLTSSLKEGLPKGLAKEATQNRSRTSFIAATDLSKTRSQARNNRSSFNNRKSVNRGELRTYSPGSRQIKTRDSSSTGRIKESNSKLIRSSRKNSGKQNPARLTNDSSSVGSRSGYSRTRLNRRNKNRFSTNSSRMRIERGSKTQGSTFSRSRSSSTSRGKVNQGSIARPRTRSESTPRNVGPSVRRSRR